MKRTLLLLFIAVIIMFVTGYGSVHDHNLSYSYGFLAGMLCLRLINAMRPK